MLSNLELLYLRRNPFIKIVIPLVLSLIICKFYILQLELSIIISSIIFFIISLFFLNKKALKNLHTNPIFSLLIFLFIFSSGITISAYKDNHTQYDYRTHLRKNSYIKGIISEPLIEKKNSYETIITIDAIINHNRQIDTYGKVKCYFPKENFSLLPKIGDQLLFQSKLNTVKAPIFPEEYNYKNYLNDKGITQTTFLPLHQFTIYGHKNSIYGYAQQLRAALIQQFKNAGLSGNELSVLSALFLGQKQALSVETKESFISAGAMHVLAVSGLHVGIILYILTSLFDFLFGKKKNLILKTVLVLFLIWGFALLTGLSISVLRSSTMFSFLALGQLISKKSSTYNTIAASAFILLIINPNSLFDVGFQLSYLALIGIIYFYPIIYNWVYIPNKYWNHLWSITAVSISAQIITIPLSIYYFHQVPIVALISNIFVIYFAIIIISLALFSLIFIAFTPIFEFLVAILNHIINELILIIKTIADIPNSTLINLYISPKELFILYISLLFIMLYQELKKVVYIQISLICVSLFFINDHFENYQLMNSKKLYIYPTEHDLTLNLIADDTNYLYTTDTSNYTINNLKRSLKNNWGVHDVSKTEFKYLSDFKNYSLQINNKLVLILNKKPTEVDKQIYDYVIINNSYIALSNINSRVTGKQFIIGSKVSSIQRKALENQNRLFNLNLKKTSVIKF